MSQRYCEVVMYLTHVSHAESLCSIVSGINKNEVKADFLYEKEEVLESSFGALHQMIALVIVLFSVK